MVYLIDLVENTMSRCIWAHGCMEARYNGMQGSAVCKTNYAEYSWL